MGTQPLRGRSNDNDNNNIDHPGRAARAWGTGGVELGASGERARAQVRGVRGGDGGGEALWSALLHKIVKPGPTVAAPSRDSCKQRRVNLKMQIPPQGSRLVAGRGQGGNGGQGKRGKEGTRRERRVSREKTGRKQRASSQPEGTTSLFTMVYL